MYGLCKMLVHYPSHLTRRMCYSAKWKTDEREHAFDQTIASSHNRPILGDVDYKSAHIHARREAKHFEAPK